MESRGIRNGGIRNGGRQLDSEKRVWRKIQKRASKRVHLPFYDVNRYCARCRAAPLLGYLDLRWVVPSGQHRASNMAGLDVIKVNQLLEMSDQALLVLIVPNKSLPTEIKSSSVNGRGTCFVTLDPMKQEY